MKKIAFILFISIAFFACEKEIIIDNALLESKLVVSAFISTDSVIVVYVYQSTPLNGFTPSKSKSDAKVTLRYDNQQTELELVAFNSYYNQGKYDTLYYYTKPNLLGVAGKTYQLEVSCPGFETVTAETTVPMPVELISIDTLSLYKLEGNQILFHQYYKLRFIDPAVENNFYRLINKKIVGKWSNAQYNEDTIRYFSIYEMGGTSYFNSSDPIFGDESDDANSYIFGGVWNSFAVFNDELINGKDYQLEVYQSTGFWGDDEQVAEQIKDNLNTSIGNFEKTTIFLQSISPELFLYLKSIELQSFNDGGPFMEPVPVYNNINNGYGIFGSYTSTNLEVTWGEYPKEGIEYLTYEEAWQKYREANPDIYE